MPLLPNNCLQSMYYICAQVVYLTSLPILSISYNGLLYFKRLKGS